MLRAVALKNHLPPDTLPEDLLLLSQDDKGNLLVKNELNRAMKWLEIETKNSENY
jgi:hypothetical protein